MSKAKSKLGPKTLVIDIETSPLVTYTWGLFNQNISIGQIVEPQRMLSFAARWYGQKKVLFYSEFHHGRKEMVQAAWDLLNEADILVHFNGKRFDVPHLNREFLEAKLPPPAPYSQVDLYQAAKRQFRFPSNKLDYIVQQLDLGSKVKHTGFELWIGCLKGDKESWALMKKYNIGDIAVTESLYEELLPWIPQHPNVGLYTGVDDACPACGSDQLKPQGFAFTNLGKFQRWVCAKCGKWSKSKKNLARVDMRSV